MLLSIVSSLAAEQIKSYIYICAKNEIVKNIVNVDTKNGKLNTLIRNY